MSLSTSGDHQSPQSLTTQSMLAAKHCQLQITGLGGPFHLIYLLWLLATPKITNHKWVLHPSWLLLAIFRGDLPGQFWAQSIVSWVSCFHFYLTISWSSPQKLLTPVQQPGDAIHRWCHPHPPGHLRNSSCVLQWWHQSRGFAGGGAMESAPATPSMVLGALGDLQWLVVGGCCE